VTSELAHEPTRDGDGKPFLWSGLQKINASRCKDAGTGGSTSLIKGLAHTFRSHVVQPTDVIDFVWGVTWSASPPSRKSIGQH
jgi:hypothetical protein